MNVLTSARSAAAVTRAAADARLLPGFGSGWSAVTAAWLSSATPAGAVADTVPVTCTVADVPTITAPTGQVSRAASTTQAAPPVTWPLTPVSPGGTVSTTLTPVASAGPALVAVSV